MELKNIDNNAKSFEANGKTYIVEIGKLSIERYIIFQKLEVELPYNGGFAGVMKSHKKVKEHLNKIELYDAIVELDNIDNCLKKADKDKRVPAIDICSLFLNTKDEDRRYMSNELLAEKQEDFEKEGIPSDFFLHLASELIIGYRQYLNQKASNSGEVSEKTEKANH